jgi:heme exporter protein C
MLYKHGWKILGVAIIVYVFLAGMLVPLKPGIVGVTPQSVYAGSKVSLQVKGYNTHYFQASNEMRAWLKMDDKHFLFPEMILINNDRDLKLVFYIPRYLPASEKVRDFTLLIDNPIDGAHVLPSAVFVTQNDINPAQGALEWPPERITDLHTGAGMAYPFRNILAETIRNTYYHVPLWFAMILLFIGSVFYSGRYLRTRNARDDHYALSLIRAGVLFGVLGLLTGAVWARYTWGAFWSGDIKQNMTAICLLIYLAYFVLRQAYEDPEQRARIAAAYAMFAFAAMIPLLFVIPRLTDSLHPGSGGNPALGGEDLDSTMRMVFYPAIIGWFLIGLWMAQISFRIEALKERWLEEE